MILLSNEIKKNLPPLYSQDEKPADQIDIVVKFFCPWNNWTWYVMEGEYQKESDTWLFFGLVIGLETEFGYFTLTELENIRGPGGLSIERDMYFKSTLAEIKENNRF